MKKLAIIALAVTALIGLGACSKPEQQAHEMYSFCEGIESACDEVGRDDLIRLSMDAKFFTAENKVIEGDRTDGSEDIHFNNQRGLCYRISGAAWMLREYRPTTDQYKQGSAVASVIKVLMTEHSLDRELMLDECNRYWSGEFGSGWPEGWPA